MKNSLKIPDHDSVAQKPWIRIVIRIVSHQTEIDCSATFNRSKTFIKIRNFLSNLAGRQTNRQTDKGKNITSFLNTLIFACLLIIVSQFVLILCTHIVAFPYVRSI